MKIIYRVLAIVVFILIIVAVVAYARGYRLDFEKRTVTPTGIIAVSAYPKAAKIYIDDKLVGVTDYNITLPPGKYHVQVKKEGYTTWSKDIILKGELVESLDVLLFPVNPSLSPLTNIGITKGVPIGQSDRLLLFSENENPETDGIYIFDANQRPLSFFPPLKLILLKSQLPTGTDFKLSEVLFSPDLKEAIIDFPQSDETIISYLISLENENTQLFEITNSKESLLTAWEEEKQLDMNKILEAFPKEIRKIATDSFQIVSLSPDKTKILYVAKQTITLPPVITPPLIATNQTAEERTLTKESLYVYDKKEDKNYHVQNPKSETLNSKQIENFKLKIENSVLWYPDSQHLVINEENKISVIDYDNTNKRTVYSGPFESYFFELTTDGKILILTNLNSQLNALPDIYAVGIR